MPDQLTSYPKWLPLRPNQAHSTMCTWTEQATSANVGTPEPQGVSTSAGTGKLLHKQCAFEMLHARASASPNLM